MPAGSLRHKRLGNLHLTALLSANQHIPLNVNEKRRLSSHRAPSPLPHLSVSLSCVPHSLTFSLNFSLSFISLSPAHSTVSCPLILTSPPWPYSGLWSFIQLLCWCLCLSGDMSEACVCCSSARSPIVSPPSSLFRTHGVAKGEIWALNQNTSSHRLSKIHNVVR